MGSKSTYYFSVVSIAKRKMIPHTYLHFILKICRKNVIPLNPHLGERFRYSLGDNQISIMQQSGSVLYFPIVQSLLILLHMTQRSPSTHDLCDVIPLEFHDYDKRIGLSGHNCSVSGNVSVSVNDMQELNGLSKMYFVHIVKFMGRKKNTYTHISENNNNDNCYSAPWPT